MSNAIHADTDPRGTGGRPGIHHHHCRETNRPVEPGSLEELLWAIEALQIGPEQAHEMLSEHAATQRGAPSREQLLEEYEIAALVALDIL